MGAKANEDLVTNATTQRNGADINFIVMLRVLDDLGLSLERMMLDSSPGLMGPYGIDSSYCAWDLKHEHTVRLAPTRMYKPQTTTYEPQDCANPP